MANQQITTYEPKKYHTDGNLNTHKSLPVVKWIGNGSGSSSYEVINQTLIPTRGNTSSDRPFEAKNTSLFNMSKIPSDIYSYREENGFEFNKTSTTSECAINVAVKHTGTNGMVIPQARESNENIKNSIESKNHFRLSMDAFISLIRK